MKLLTITTLLISLIACKPEQEVTNFNVLIKAPLGEDVNLQVEEDSVLEFEYYIPKNEESINLQIAIYKKPVNGKLEGCDTISEGKIKCTYRPNPDFFGKDSIQVVAQDGDIKGDQPSTISIDVINVPDAPKALDTSFNIGSKEVLNVVLPEGIDSDSLSSELSYSIVNGPSNGELIDCVGRNCKYISDSLYEGVDTIQYKVSDNTGLDSELGTITINVSRITFIGSETFNSQVDSLQGADIIWVIDNSGSMDNEQASLRANFDAFINNFLVNGKARFKFNMAVTTTDVYEKNNLVNPFSVNSDGNTYDLSSVKAEANFASFKEDFQAAVSVGINGSGYERAFDSISTAYNKQPSFYAGNDHLLVYIILSDEREQSTTNYPSSQAFFNSISALKDQPEKVLVYPIINLNADNGNRYAEIAQLAGTSVYNINQPFSDVLNAISLNVSSNVKSYKLNTAVNIIPSSVKVKINGVETNEFTYLNNSITLTNAPQGAATIVVSYDYGVL